MLAAEPVSGRVYRAEREVRLGDVDPGGRLRFDACARYVQDVASDDSRDAALPDVFSWVVRRTEQVVAGRPPRLGEPVALATWCSGTGSRWAERRVSVAGARGGRVEVASLWVHVDPARLAPRRLPGSFLATYGEAAGGRTVGSRLVLPGPEGGAERRPWPLRRVDLDVLGHVNNAAYWAVVEEVVGERPELVAGPHRAVVEFARAIEPGAGVDLLVAHGARSASLWLQVDGTTHAAAHLALL